MVKQQRYNDDVRYSLVVSIKTQQTEVDLYNAVGVAITNATAIVI